MKVTDTAPLEVLVISPHDINRLGIRHLIDDHMDGATVMEERAEEFGTTVDQRRWRLVGPMHLADTREQAVADVAFGLPQWLDYFQRVAALPLGVESDDPAEMAQAMNDSGFAVIGTVEDAIAQIQRLIDQSGGFGTFLFLAHNCASWEATKRSYELFAEYVIPACRNMNVARDASIDWVGQNTERFFGAMQQATREAIARFKQP